MYLTKQNIRFLLVWIVANLFVLTSSENVVAQSEYSFDIFTQENGLPNNQIQSVYQDSKGWMWIGTSQGLSRFDGYDFLKLYPQF